MKNIVKQGEKFKLAVLTIFATKKNYKKIREKFKYNFKIISLKKLRNLLNRRDIRKIKVKVEKVYLCWHTINLIKPY